MSKKAKRKKNREAGTPHKNKYSEFSRVAEIEAERQKRR